MWARPDLQDRSIHDIMYKTPSSLTYPYLLTTVSEIPPVESFPGFRELSHHKEHPYPFPTKEDSSEKVFCEVEGRQERLRH